MTSPDLRRPSLRRPSPGRPSLRRPRPKRLLAIASLLLAWQTPSFAGDSDEFDIAVGENARAAATSTLNAIVWEADDADETGVFGRLYDNASQPLSEIFAVNTETAEDQDEPDVAWLAGGDFAVVWTHDLSTETAIEARLFAATGAALGKPFRIDESPLDAETPRAAADALGRFAVVWGGGGIYHRLVSSTGVLLGAELEVTASTLASSPAIAIAGDGEQLVVWEEQGEIRARRLDAMGQPLGAEILVNVAGAGDRSDPTVTSTADGAFVVAWRSEGQDGSAGGIFARRVEVGPEGPEWQLNETTAGEQEQPSLGSDARGQILATWETEGAVDGDGRAVVGRFLRPTGRPICPDTLINVQSIGEQRLPAVAGAAADFLVVWQSEPTVPVPGVLPELSARRIASPVFIDDFESGDLGAWSVVVP
ncbi:MAG: hypothetical protein AAGC60_09385 [Acidobacteriota bacterium]